MGHRNLLATSFFMQRIIATFFSHVSSETEYNAVRVINYTILRGGSSLSARTIQVRLFILQAPVEYFAPNFLFCVQNKVTTAA